MNNTKKGDSGAKLIFGNEELVSQLLRNYSGLDILKDVQAEDIEDVTDRYVPMFEEERDSDVVKRIRLRGSEKPFFLISLIEHKSRVDYNVTMQLLRYMVFIWIDYEREMKKQTGNKDIARSKSFKYPPILPVVYYEDSGRWTADMNFSERIMLRDVFGPFIPEFTYKLIQLNSYTKSELIGKQDELSLVMLINKLQDASEFKDLELPEDYLRDLSANTPDEVLEIISKVITVMLRKLKLEEREILDFTDQVRERKMGELFENFRGYDVPAVRREARAEGKAEGKAEGEITRLIKQVCKKLEKHRTETQIAEELEEDVDMVTKICGAVGKVGTHDAEAIYQILKSDGVEVQGYPCGECRDTARTDKS